MLGNDFQVPECRGRSNMDLPAEAEARKQHKLLDSKAAAKR